MKIIDRIKNILLKIFSVKTSIKSLHKFEELKRNRFIKKLRSNAIAIITNQIDIHSGSMKMNYYIGRIEDIKPLENIDLKVFNDFYNAFSIYPIIEEKQYFNKEYLEKLDKELNSIDNKYKLHINEKCKEIIKKFEYIKTVC